jgi:hypothetical protein
MSNDMSLDSIYDVAVLYKYVLTQGTAACKLYDIPNVSYVMGVDNFHV